MSETSMIQVSGTQAPAEGATQRLAIQEGQDPVSSGNVFTEFSTFPVLVKTSEAKVLVRVDMELMRRQQETEKANEAIRRRQHG
jgi:hypothetical protein